MRTLAIFDIDGVLADCTHRLHYAKAKDYDKFYADEEILKDTPIRSGIELLQNMATWADIWLATGRSQRCDMATLTWLQRVVGRREVLRGLASFRDEGDFRPSPVLKVEQLKDLFRESKKRSEGYFVTQDVNPIYFIDDDPENVKAVEKAFPSITGIVFSTKRF